MNIYQRLIEDHKTQREIAEKLMETSGDSPERRALFERFKTELDAHALAEEQTFYSDLMQHPDGTEKARHSVAEHKDADDLLQELSDLEMSSGGWIHKFEKLKHEVIHHVDEEEKEVFPLARKLIAPSRAEELADDFDDRKSKEAS
tara:strand:+ start:94164 stop:94601 length:438 start_codon:yes stop_codon:yes gene_type:complete